ncbi:hypothetical protein BKI52_21845 [marine bacterium AO1-C]|nr:hypothetical protein BKI52_21845 [marine bacterium AO1-C]
MLSPGVWSQNDKSQLKGKIDSLKKELNKPENANYKFVRELVYEVVKMDSTEHVVEIKQLERLLRKRKSSFFKIMQQAIYAHYYDRLKRPDQGLGYMDKALDQAKKQNLNVLLGELIFEQAYIRRNAQKEDALKSFLQSHEIFKKQNKNARAAQALYEAAIMQYGSDVSASKKRGVFEDFLQIANIDSIYHRNIINAHTAIAMIDIGKKDYKAAENQLTKAMEISEAKKDSAWIGILSGNFSQLYVAKGEYEKALKYLEIDKKLSKKNGERMSLAFVYTSFGEIYYKQKKYKISQRYYDSSRVVSKIDNSILYRPWQIAFTGLAKTYAALNDYKKAYLYKDSAKIAGDTIYRRSLRNKINQVQASYNVSKKQKEVELLTKEKALNKATIQRQNLINIAVGGGLLLMLLLAFVLLRSNRERKKKNVILNKQQQEILTQNEELYQQQEEIKAQQEFVENQNKELTRSNLKVTQSLKAAQLIQKAIWPYEEKLNALLEDYFVIYRPKDVVSGDFYWLNKLENKTFIIAADCTGHGIPGAFMSLICNTLFDKIIRVWKMTNTGEILDKAREEIRILLRQKELGYANGMDVAIIIVEEAEEGVEEKRIQFSGAKRPLYYIKEGTKKLEEVRGDRVSIGGRPRREEVDFTVHELTLAKGSLIYLGSDGFADQNNKRRRPITATKLKAKLEEYACKALPEQQKLLEEYLDEHMMGTEQRDDILLIGTKVT